MATEGSTPATALVVMGVSGVGKTTIASALGSRLGWPFAEADSFHSQDNIAKMSAGTPLTDDDRWPWLRAIRDWISEHGRNSQSAVLTCSALKRSYRDVLSQADAEVRFVHLTATADALNKRMAHRTDHFMPPELLRSQLDALEPLDNDERGIVVDAAKAPAEIVEAVLAAL